MPAFTTSGFQVQERPRLDYMDPRLLTPKYSEMLPAFQQGLGVYSGLQQIADEAQARPTRQQLLQIQLQDAQNRLGLAPMERELKMAQISEAQQNAAFPRELVENVTISGGEKGAMINNPDAGFGNLQFTDVFTPKTETTTGRRFIGDIQSPFTKTKTLKTSAELAIEDRKLEADIAAREALAGYRGQMGGAATMNAKSRAEAQANAAARIAQGTVIARGADDSTGNLIVTIRNPDGTVEAIDTQTKPIAPVPAQVQLVREFMDGAPAASPPVRAAPAQPLRAAPGPAKAPVQFNTEQEAAAAADAGLIEAGDAIIVGGRPAKWQ